MSKPAFLNLFLSDDAPIALEPMPASHAKITLLTSDLFFVICLLLLLPLLCFFIVLTLLCAASNFSSPGFFFIKNEATTKDTAVEIVTPAMTGIKPPFGVIAINANILPGDGVATRPAPNKLKVKTPLAPPAITANTKIGFINTYGK